MPDQAEIRISASTPRQSPNIPTYRGSAGANGAGGKTACHAGFAFGTAEGRPNCGASGRGFESRLPPSPSLRFGCAFLLYYAVLQMAARDTQTFSARWGTDVLDRLKQRSEAVGTNK